MRRLRIFQFANIDAGRRNGEVKGFHHRRHRDISLNSNKSDIASHNQETSSAPKSIQYELRGAVKKCNGGSRWIELGKRHEGYWRRLLIRPICIHTYIHLQGRQIKDLKQKSSNHPQLVDILHEKICRFLITRTWWCLLDSTGLLCSLRCRSSLLARL